MIRVAPFWRQSSGAHIEPGVAAALRDAAEELDRLNARLDTLPADQQEAERGRLLDRAKAWGLTAYRGFLQAKGHAADFAELSNTQWVQDLVNLFTGVDPPP